MTDSPDLRRYRARWHRLARLVAQRLVLAPVVRSVTRTQVQGAENLEGLRPPFVVVANHNSHLDTAVLVTSLPYRVTRHLAVGAAADYFYGRWWMKAVTSLFFNTYPVQRAAGPARSGKGLSKRLIAQDVPVLIYPEGTRSRNGVMQRFHSGAAALCVTSGVPCVPVVLLGTREAMPVGRGWPVPGRPRVQVLVGRPLTPRSEERTGDFNGRLSARMTTMMQMKSPYVVGTDGRDTHPPSSDDAQEQAS
jgi:1-acyl-sn-glycerol-3-phosphate acyltransferase